MKGMHKEQKRTKQLTFDNLPKAPIQQKPKTPKQIIITHMETAASEDELTLKVAFKLQPSKTAFSKVKSDLFFNGEIVNSVLLRIPQGPLATDECEYSTVLDMKGIAAGAYALTAEVYEQWQTGERLCEAVKELTFTYVPQTRLERLVKIPTVKKVAGADLAVVRDFENKMFREMESNLKKEQMGKRDSW
jgi:hypothetical protein